MRDAEGLLAEPGLAQHLLERLRAHNQLVPADNVLQSLARCLVVVHPERVHQRAGERNVRQGDVVADQLGLQLQVLVQDVQQLV